MRINFDVEGAQVSTNAAYRAGRGRFWKDVKAVAWQARIMAQAVKTMGRHPAIAEDVIVVVDFFFGSRRNDLDGPLKLVLDALQPRVICNDRQVRSITLRKHLDTENPHTRIEVATL
jgi:Holliday junction resolvase RusA-like endonuclease